MRNTVYLFVFILVCFTAGGFKNPTPQVSWVHEYCRIKYPSFDFSEFIFIRIRQQRLYYIKNHAVLLEFPVSTSRYGAGFKKDSEKTPWGLHRICIMTGNTVPPGGIITGNKFSGKMAEIQNEPVETGRDDITSRALRLEGMEDGLNKGGDQDTYVREIYIHGTPEEGLIGTPSSHGCVRMKNADIIELFSHCKNYLPVLLLNN